MYNRITQEKKWNTVQTKCIISAHDVSTCSQCYLHPGLMIVLQKAEVAGLEGICNMGGTPAVRVPFMY